MSFCCRDWIVQPNPNPCLPKPYPYDVLLLLELEVYVIQVLLNVMKIFELLLSSLMPTRNFWDIWLKFRATLFLQNTVYITPRTVFLIN